ncbi:MAG TPA: MATE family efflux transporter [Eubacteriaceae bacterium]|nr:MATE family efflux transporter [Eubacteriaceae bacterium]
MRTVCRGFATSVNFCLQTTEEPMNYLTKLIRSSFEREFQKTMFSIALPIMIQSFMMSFLNMIDTIMVGRLGETEIASVGIANQFYFFYNMLLIGLCGGVSVFISQYWGRRDEKNIKKILGVGLSSVVLLSILFIIIGFYNPDNVIRLFSNDILVEQIGTQYLSITVFSYFFTGVSFLYGFSLRSIGRATLPMIVNMVAIITNVILNYLLIFGNLGFPTLGVNGAAIATLIARVTEAILLMFFIYRFENPLRAKISELLSFKRHFVKRAYKTITPVVFNDMFWGLATLTYIAVYGRMGTAAMATIQIGNTVNNLFMVIAFGLSNASAIMIGNSIGEGKPLLAFDYAKKFIVSSFFISLGIGVLLALFSPMILQLYKVSETVRYSAQAILYMISAIFSIRVLAILLIVGILRGGGDAGKALLIEGFTMWGVGVPLLLFGAFVLQWPVHWVYALAMTEEIVKCILSLFRLKSGKWIHDLT